MVLQCFWTPVSLGLFFMPPKLAIVDGVLGIKDYGARAELVPNNSSPGGAAAGLGKTVVASGWALIAGS
jgi:hypothetical protein